MAEKTYRIWIFPILSLLVGPIYISVRRIPFSDLWLAATIVTPKSMHDWDSIVTDASLLFLVALFGFIRAKPKEIWSYGFYMGTPLLLLAVANLPSDGAKVVLFLLTCFFIAATIAAYAGFALRKAVDRIRAVPGKPPSIITK